MDMPGHGGQGPDHPAKPVESTPGGPLVSVGVAEHCVCGAVGLLATLLTLVGGYSLFLAATRPLGMFASTALVFLAVALWIGSWLALELLWEWRAGRLPATD
jgi:hypothetical protein